MAEVMTKDEFTISETMLDVGDGHKLYVQDWGNKNAKTPVIFLHGGPGGGVYDNHKQPFDPAKQRVIFFDQRGSGQSTPKGSLSRNTTDDLVEDIEKIANHLRLGEFVITGGSWGSYLALVYATKYSHRVKGMALRGIFTGTKAEIDWLDQGRFKTFYPEVWEKFVQSTPPQYHHEPGKYHFKTALGRGLAAKKSAYAYENLEFALLKLDDRFMKPDFKDYDPSAIRIEIHYLTHNCFMPERYIYDNAAKLTMPIWLVQGRYDMVCPPMTAYELNRVLPNSNIAWTIAGHSGGERAIYDLLHVLVLQLTEN